MQVFLLGEIQQIALCSRIRLVPSLTFEVMMELTGLPRTNELPSPPGFSSHTRY